MKWGILFRWGSFWIGAHWSPYNRRLCVNLMPFITLWITTEGGMNPDQGVNVFRNDMDDLIKKSIAAEHERRIFLKQKQIANAEAASKLLSNLSTEQLQRLHEATQQAIREEISFEEYKTIVDNLLTEEPCKHK